MFDANMNYLEELHGTGILLNKISYLDILTYPFSRKSLFRLNQNEFVKICSKFSQNSIIEIGSEAKYKYKEFFNINFIETNFERENFQKLDVTGIELKTESVENYLCISVLEHVFDVKSAASEISRTLKTGGYLFIVVPFAYPKHDVVDYWRFLPDAYIKLFNTFELVELYHLGGKFSSCAEVLKRPRGKMAIRYLPARLLGWISILFSKFFEQIDGFPHGYGLILQKKSCVASSANSPTN